MASPSVAAVAVISADNTPRFIETYTDGNSDAALALHSACYSALDVVDERVAAARVRGSGSAAAIADCYLGELLPPFKPSITFFHVPMDDCNHDYHGRLQS